ncbi:MAG: cupin domain-containing protein [Dehalococcoidia bacterium]
MRVVRLDDAEPQPSDAAIFMGGVASRPLLDQPTEHVRLGLVRFSPGARTRLHRHTYEQVLVITEGKGIVATESEQWVVTPGAVVVIPQGEPHTHGATEDTAMAHISIGTPGETILLE